MCPGLPHPDNGDVEIGGTQPEDEAKYFCNLGYRLVGDEIRICSNGIWSGEAPVCRGEKYATILNSVFTFKSSYIVQTHYTRTNYFLSLTSEIRCPVLPSIANGVILMPDNTLGSIAEFTCDVGYELVGSTLLTCLETEIWDLPAPNCQQRIISQLTTA